MNVSRMLLLSAASLAVSGIAMAPEGIQQGFIGSSPITAIVHKQDHEGTITIDPVTGNILTMLDERPEWAEGLTVAQVSQRLGYYQQALGDKFTDAMKMPEILAFEDLDWLAVRDLGYSAEDIEKAQLEDPNFDGFEHIELSASEEFRAEVVATVLEIKGDLEAIEQAILTGEAQETGNEGTLTTVDLSAELMADNLRSQEELEELEEARKAGFERAHG